MRRQTAEASNATISKPIRRMKRKKIKMRKIKIHFSFKCNLICHVINISEEINHMEDGLLVIMCSADAC